MRKLTVSFLYILLGLGLNACSSQGFVLPGGGNSSSSSTTTPPTGGQLPPGGGGGGPIFDPALAGQLDPSFGGTGFIESAYTAPLGSTTERLDASYEVKVQSDGKTLILGNMGGTGAAFEDKKIVLKRLNMDGSVDLTFGNGGTVITEVNAGRRDVGYEMLIQADGKILVAGYTRNASDESEFLILRYNANGSLDSTFSGDGILTYAPLANANSEVWTFQLQADGKIIAGGRSSFTTDNVDFPVLFRVNANGTIDTTFGSGGLVTLQSVFANASRFHAVSVHASGKIVAGGFALASADENDRDMLLAQFNSNGSLDTTFGSGGIRTTFLTSGSGVRDSISSLATTADGKITVIGDSNGQIAIARFTASGFFDNGFGSGGSMMTDLNAQEDEGLQDIVLQSDGKIVVAGYVGTQAFGGSSSMVVARYLSNGQFDSAFGNGGVTLISPSGGLDLANDIALAPDGRILVTGFSNPADSVYNWVTARLFP